MNVICRRVYLASGLVALLGMTGCGYRPLYGAPDGGGDVAQSLASVRVEEEQSRLGQLVRNELISTMGSGGSGGYSLKLDVSENTAKIVTYPEPRTNRKAATVEVGYDLFGADSRKALTKGKVRSSVSYDLTRDQQPITDRQARADAEQRAALEIAGEIRTRLAVYFSRRP